jgi:hypothetical protein
MLLRKGTDERAKQGHKERRAHAFIAHIADHQAQSPVLDKGKHIVEIPGNLAGRLKAGNVRPYPGARRTRRRVVPLPRTRE